MGEISKKLTAGQIADLACKNGYEFAALNAIIQVESGGIGFASDTGKIIIQFEPAWFKRKNTDWAKDTQHTVWQANKVGKQSEEWKAFNDAYAEDANAAMESTSIGLMQVMGFHYSELGFKTVGAMWDFAKESEANQVQLAIAFIKTNSKLDAALKNKDWATFAYYYNGAGYKQFKYDTRIAAAYNKSK